MNLEEWYLKGMTAQQYVDSMDKNQENLIYIYEHFDVADEDHDLFEQLQKRGMKAIVLTEDWCGDAMLNIPIFLRMAEAGHIKTHFLLRDDNSDLMDKFLTNGSRSIPKIILLNTEGETIGTWGPRSPEIQQFIDHSNAGLPERHVEDFKEKQTEMLTFVTKSFRDNHDFWRDVYNDLKKTLLY